MLDAVYEVRKEDGAVDENLAEIRAIMEGKIAEEKIRVANTVLPESIKVPGRNALYDIYSRLSNGMHARDEQQCMAIANWASPQLEYVITQLSAARIQRRERRAYEDNFNDFAEDGV